MLQGLPALLLEPSALDWGDALAALAAFVVFYFVSRAYPLTLVRPGLWVLVKLLYRLHVRGAAGIPRSGGVLMLCNHVSYLDWLLVLAASPRPVLFLTQHKYLRNPLFFPWLWWSKSVPVTPGSGPRGLRESLNSVADALRRGEVVCMFPEGRRTRTGRLQPFQRGLEELVKRSPIPVVPVYVDRMWGSVFSRSARGWLRRPRRWSEPVTVAFGEAMAPPVTAADAHQAVQRLSADVAERAHEWLLPAHRRWVRQACRRPFGSAAVDTSGPTPRLYTHAKLLAGAQCLTGWLRKKLGDDAAVGLWLPPSVGAVMANAALAFLRKTSVNLNYTNGPDALMSALRQSGVRRVLTSRRFTARVPLDCGPNVELIYLDDAAGEISGAARLSAFLKVVLLPGWILDRWVLGLGSHSRDDLATVIFSSGSTGEPKGVMLSHRNIAENVDSMVRTLALTPRDRLLGVLPFFHSFGYTVTVWCPLVAGCSVVYHPDPRQAQEVGDLCRTHQCSLFLSTATFLRFYIKRCGDHDFRSLRLLICGAEKLPVSLAKDFEAKFGVLPLEGYGCTELSPVVSSNLPDVGVGRERQVTHKPGTVGLPITNVVVRVADPCTLDPLPIGQEGMVLVRGANRMVGYLGRDDLTALAVRDGWYVTGDMGRLDADGFLSITGRLARFAKVAGEMVPLEKLEEELHAALGVTDRVFAVAAVPDERRGERVVVLHKPLPADASAQQLAAALKERGLPNLWIPTPRDYFPVDELPLLSAGKLDLCRVKDLALAVTRASA